MNIYLIRHAEAEQTSEGKPHEERALTAKGIEILKESIIIWKSFATNFDIILSSPLKRSKQTAAVIYKIYRPQFEVTEEICLLNGGLTEDLISIARSLNMNDIAMVGHQPDIGIHINAMIGSTTANIKMLPAAIVKISFNEKPKIGNGVCEFLLPPINK
jgi:phosphohistidine phosphatase